MLLAFCASAFAQTTIHVPADQPTIQAGVRAAHDGDTVLVAPGSYTENLDFLGKAITVTSGATSYTEASSTILNGTGNVPIVRFQSGETRASVFNGFTIQNAQGSAIFMQSSGTVSNNAILNTQGCAIVIYGFAASPMVTGNRVAGTDVGKIPCNGFNGYQTAISVEKADDVVLTGNLIEDNIDTSGSGSAVALGANDTNTLTVQGNTIRNNIGFVGVSMGTSNIINLNLIQNLIYGNRSRTVNGGGPTHHTGGAGVGIGILSFVIRQPPTYKIFGNTIYGNHEEGFTGSGYQYGGQLAIFVGQASTKPVQITAFFENNIFGEVDGDSAVGCGTGGSLPPLDMSNITWRHNDTYNTGQQLGAPGCTAPGAPGDLAVDPLFLNPAGADFHTQPSSPVVGAGDMQALVLPPSDLDGKNRTVCGAVDMGVYEVHPHPPITITSTPNPSVGGSSVFFTAKVAGNCNVPTGSLTFYDGATPLGTTPLDASASATFNTASLTVGSHTITARYPGDFNFEDSTSNAIVQVVTGYPTATTLQVSPNPAQAFQSIALSARVASQFGTPTGTVSFLSGTTLLGTVTVSATGQAAMTVNTLSVGTYNITATYNATTQYAGSVSATVVEVVVGSPSTTTLTATPNPSAFGQTVTFTANLTASGSIPTGTVTFLDGGTILSSVPIAGSGLATLNTASLAAGSHTITAAYGGSANYNASTSNAVIQVVTPPPPPPDFTLLVNPTALDLGLKASGTTLVTLAPTSPGLGPVLLTCGPLPVAASCSFSASTISFSTSAAQTSILTIHIAPSSAKNESYPARNSRAPLFLAGFLLAPGLLLGSFKRPRGLRNLCLAGLLMMSAISMSSCGYTRYPISETAYQIAVQATAQNLGTLKQQSVTVTAAR